MAFISPEEINNIRSSVSIVDIISTYIPLNQRGKNYFGVCPFHEDHSPSMSVSSEKQMYKCFSCGAAGNVFTFIENYLNVSFGEAVSLVAEKAGISIKADFLPQKEVKNQKEYDLMALVLKIYQNNLNTEAGNKAIQYLNERKLEEDVRKDFDIGLALDDNILTKLLLKKDYSEKLLVDLGLLNNNDLKLHDVLKDRIVFPLHDLDGNVIGFTARCYLSDIKPKYLNTKETAIFKKGNILYNYHRAKDTIRLKKEVILVEGNMDAIRMYANGIKNVVALMGTSLTKEQIKALKKLRAKIVLMLDNDEAGEDATYRLGNILEKEAFEIQIVRLNGAKDPDEYILKYNAEAIIENIMHAGSFMDFKLNYLKKNKNLNSAVDLAEYIKTVIENLKSNPDEILKEVTLQKLSNDYNISYAVLKEQLKIDSKIKVKTEKNEEEKKKKTTYEKLANEILYFMMNDAEYIKLYQTRLGFFPTKKERMIASEILYYYNLYKTINLADFITYIATINLKKEIMDIIESVRIQELSDEAMIELLEKLKKKMEQEEIKCLKKELKNEFDPNKKMELAKKLVEIKKGSVKVESY